MKMSCGTWKWVLSGSVMDEAGYSSRYQDDSMRSRYCRDSVNKYVGIRSELEYRARSRSVRQRRNGIQVCADRLLSSRRGQQEQSDIRHRPFRRKSSTRYNKSFYNHNFMHRGNHFVNSIGENDSKSTVASGDSDEPGHDMSQYCKEFLIPELGILRVTTLKQEELNAAAVVLTRCFAASPQGIPINECRSYLQNMLNAPPRGVLLVGRLYPLDSEDECPWLPPGQKSRLIATASISFHPDTRESFLSAKPPDEDAYLANIGVDPSFRRHGVARKMLECCEKLAQDQSCSSIYLHVRLGDIGPLNLYTSAGYSVVYEDSWLLKLRGRTPTALMCKAF